MTPVPVGALERWIAWIRAAAVLWAIFQVGVIPTPTPYPEGRLEQAWLAVSVLAVGAVALLWLALREQPPRWLGPVALLFDAGIVSAFVLVYSFAPGTPIRQLLFIPVVEAALRYGLTGGIAMPFLLTPVSIVFEEVRADATELDIGNVTFSIGVHLIGGLFVGWLVRALARQTSVAESRAAEAERLRDELGRRADILDATNRVARSLGSSLELEQAFSAFIRELRGLVPFDRVAIILHDGDALRLMAAAGAGADEVHAPGSRFAPGEVAQRVLESGQTLYRRDMTVDTYPEEQELVGRGLHSRVAAPILLGARATGILGIIRRDPDAFSDDEVELVTLLGRLVASAVQNIRSYEAERSTVEELRRLSALRADFVSLVSHELRSPMAAVIGSARTLQQRWRALTPEQRESFLALIADETTRLANLIGDVLDTSRIEAGTFTYAFGDVDVTEIVRDSVATAELAQDEVRLEVQAPDSLPRIRGDRERLRQVLANLIDNAVKYTPTGGLVSVTAYGGDGYVRIDVSDEGPGIAPEHEKVIFEKFGRVTMGRHTKPGTGLGLFIARSITEAHGGKLDVRANASRGTTFTVSLPVEH